MSKKKDREDTSFRNCPICGSIAIFVKKIKRDIYIECQNCNKTIKVEVII